MHSNFPEYFMKKKAIFLDRDGVLNREIGEYVHRVDQFVVNEGVGEALAKWMSEGYVLVVITNQGGISKGLYGHEEVRTLHRLLDAYLEAYGVRILEYFYSPYHKDYCKSLCSKPGSLMVERALAKYDINPALSYMIGDRERDILAAEGAGVKGIMIESNTDLRTVKLGNV